MIRPTRTLYLIVAVAAFTGARRNEILALRWSDFDAEAKALRIARSLEEMYSKGQRKHQRKRVRFKEPKTARGSQ
jgi:integrase